MLTKHIRGAAFSATVAVALAFGASQALATPRAAAQSLSCPWGCSTGDCDCDVYCTDIGGSWGFCNGNTCQCFL